MKKLILGILFIFIIFTTGCENLTNGSFSDIITPSVDPADLSILAPGSLKPALDELTFIFEDENPKLTLNFYFGNLSDLNAQIEGGKNIDFVIGSSQKFMNGLAQDGFINPETRENLVQNTLVLAANVDSELTSLDDLTTRDVREISIGDPDEVASGQYAVEALENLDLYEEVEDKLEYADSTSEMVTDLEDKEVDVAIMYKSDVVGNDNLRIIEEIPAGTYSPIIYPMAATMKTQYTKQVKILEEFLMSDQAQSMLSSYGFTPIMVPEETSDQTTVQETPTTTEDQTVTDTENTTE